MRRCEAEEGWCNLLAWTARVCLPAEAAEVRLAATAVGPSLESASSQPGATELSVPLQGAGRRLGVLIVSGPRESSGFSQAQVDMLTALAELASQAWSGEGDS